MSHPDTSSSWPGSGIDASASGAGATVGRSELAGLRELADRVGAACRASGRTVAVAESCTGGLVGHAITEVPGSSAWFRGGAIAYGNDIKQAVLGVAEETLGRHGAVSAQVAVAMAEGALRVFGADVAVAVTGIAGPAGGTAAKPVGLTYVAVADTAGHDVRRHAWQGTRSSNKLRSAGAALELLLGRLAGGRQGG